MNSNYAHKTKGGSGVTSISQKWAGSGLRWRGVWGFDGVRWWGHREGFLGFGLGFGKYAMLQSYAYSFNELVLEVEMVENQCINYSNFGSLFPTKTENCTTPAEDPG